MKALAIILGFVALTAAAKAAPQFLSPQVHSGERLAYLYSTTISGPFTHRLNIAFGVTGMCQWV